jgi:hypothetical protein
MMDRAGDLRSRAAIVPFGEATPAHGDVPETPKSQRDHDHTPQAVLETSPVCTAKRSLSDTPRELFHGKKIWSSGGMPPKLELLVSDGIRCQPNCQPAMPAQMSVAAFTRMNFFRGPRDGNSEPGR